MTDLTLTTSRTIAAPAQKIFDAWLDPKMIAKFMIPAPGMGMPTVKNDPVEGGRFEIIMKAGDNDIPHAGTYTKILRYSQLVFTWESPFSIDGSTVTLDFENVAGGTNVTLTHVKFPDEESRDNHEAGWGAILEKLDAVTG
ncbi:SRPBCC family protein [Sulfitobacter sp. MF3-043]|uniref:SRPBCC family protein n=1 Tax=Sulfitobacter sediminivivens TaxID=3252902 RepID=UPI0036DB7CD4